MIEKTKPRRTYEMCFICGKKHILLSAEKYVWEKETQRYYHKNCLGELKEDGELEYTADGLVKLKCSLCNLREWDEDEEEKRLIEESILEWRNPGGFCCLRCFKSISNFLGKKTTNKSKKNQPTPNKIRRAIIAQVQKFQEMSKEIPFISPAGCKLKNITGSRNLLSIRNKTHIICSHWGKSYEDVEEMLKMAESIRKSYVNLIFRTNFIRDPEIQEKLDEVPLALAKIIKNYEINKTENISKSKTICFQCLARNSPGGKMSGLCSPCSGCETRYKEEEKRQHERYLTETNVRVDNLGVNKEWKYKNSKCETCQMPFSQMKERNIPQRLWNKKLYCEEHYDKVLVTEAKKNTTKQ